MFDKLIIVDVQPAYCDFINFEMDKFTSWINKSSFDSIYCLYNGDELGYDDDPQIISDWYYRWGLSGDISIEFFEKSYGWFRDFMKNIDDENIVNIGKYMIEHDIWDSRDFKRKDIKVLSNRGIDTSLLNDRVMYIPELENYLSNNIYSDDKIFVCGGGSVECYYEVKLLLQMMNIPYQEKRNFVY